MQFVKTQVLGYRLSSCEIIGFPIHALNFESQIALILRWAKDRLGKAVCLANVHMLMEAYKDPSFASVLRSADLVAADGMPLVWMLRCLGARAQDRVAGMDVLLSLCELAPRHDVSVFWLGSEPAVLERIRAKVETEFPSLQIAGMEPLPFRPLTQKEDEELIDKVNRSGAGIVFVCLGCPKQEFWIAEHKHRIQAVMIGLGGAFPVYAGIHKRAPYLIRSTGFEWLYRLAQEPSRLWGRYSRTIPPFIWLCCQQLFFRRRFHS